jgi:hypothetical protein
MSEPLSRGQNVVKWRRNAKSEGASDRWSWRSALLWSRSFGTRPFVSPTYENEHVRNVPCDRVTTYVQAVRIRPRSPMDTPKSASRKIWRNPETYAPASPRHCKCEVSPSRRWLFCQPSEHVMDEFEEARISHVIRVDGASSGTGRKWRNLPSHCASKYYDADISKRSLCIRHTVYYGALLLLLNILL